MKLSIVGSLILASVSAFVLDSLDMDENTLEKCCFCDDRSDFHFNLVAARALREYMSQRHLKLAIMKNDIEISFTLPNENIDTGHSCKVRSEARNVNVKAAMEKKKEYLDSNLDDPDYVEELYTTFIGGRVKHNAEVSLDIRNRFGVKVWPLGCRQYLRKTCYNTKATTSGNNTVAFKMAAKDVTCFESGGKQLMRFKLNIEGIDVPRKETYSPIRVNTNDCKLPFNLFRLNSKVTSYAKKYLKNQKVRPIVSDRMMEELEEVLKAQMGKDIIIPINVTGGSGRKKRAVSCTKKVCPKGFSRIGNTEMCKTNFGLRRPNCSSYASNAKLKSRRVWRWTFYWCEAPRIAA